MHSFYLVNNCQDLPLPGWRHSLHTEFTRRHPELTISEQNIVDRKNVIVRKKYITELELQQIKQGVGRMLYQENIVRDCSEAREQENEDVLLPTRPSGSHNEIEEKFLSIIAHYQNSGLLSRPIIPRLKNPASVKLFIDKINELLNKHLKPHFDLEQVHLFLYCAAVTVTELGGQSVYVKKEDNKRRVTCEPPWKIRIEKDIEKLKRHLGIHEG